MAVQSATIPFPKKLVHPANDTQGDQQTQSASHHPVHFWLFVLCLTGVDYFSTLAYQPGIAYNATGYLAPIATAVLVIFTLFGALTVYRLVAMESPHGQGSISMLERLLPGWKSKALVLILLGFAATDFIITITLSGADAAQHFSENQLIVTHTPTFMHNQFAATLVLLGVLMLVFLRGFSEAIRLAVVLVGVYLFLNLITLAVAMQHIFAHPALLSAWHTNLSHQYPSSFAMGKEAIIKFPALALGLSGFETGVAVMPLVKSKFHHAHNADSMLTGRITNTRKLLTTAAIVMSVYLVFSSIATTVLIPPAAYAPGGGADGRAISYLAHTYLGSGFGSVYDLSSILILWFAGASAMAGLLTLVPRYLPRFGMAPQWAANQRPLVIVFTAIGVLVTIIFRASVEAQGSAYATGVLVLMLSASVAVALAVFRQRRAIRYAFMPIVISFVYITLQNVRERPDGLKIATVFICSIIVISLVSRIFRATELRINDVELDETANTILQQYMRRVGRQNKISFILHRPSSDMSYREHVRKVARHHHITTEMPLVECSVHNPADFETDLMTVRGEYCDGVPVLRCEGVAVPNMVAALGLKIYQEYGCEVHFNATWTLGNPLAYAGKFLLWGEGDTARVVQHILQKYVSEDGGVYMHVA